jgi:16S rRNA (guanine527-N7)-methyltransferase
VTIHEKLARRASKVGLVLSSDVLGSLETYFELLRKWNRKISLTALPVEDAGDEAIDRLLIEPVLAKRHLPSEDGAALDIGSGGGSPAIPMKLAAPHLSMRMVEAKTRKAAFLREVIRELDLKRTEVETVRFEELLARPLLHEGFDVVTIRAVRIDRQTLAQIQSFVRPGGCVMLFSTAASAAPKFATHFLDPVGCHVLLSQWGSQLELFQKRID